VIHGRSSLPLVALLLACGTPPSPPPRTPARITTEPEAPPSATGLRRTPTAIEAGVIQRLQRDAATVRELAFRAPVAVEVHDSVAIADHLTQDVTEEDLDKARLVYGTLGLLAPDTDVRALLAEVLGAQVVGYYDTDIDRLVVRDDVMRMLGTRPGSRDAAEAEIVLVHELVHALQDQHLGLGERYERERDSDPSNALRSVAEGDATLAMIAHGAGLDASTLLATPAIDEVLARVGALPVGEDELGRAPAILRETLVGPYVHGLRFCVALHRAGGWRAIDDAFREAPPSAEQIMHPRKYFERELPDELVLPPLPGLDEDGWTLVEEDTLGEMEIAVYLGQGTETEIDRDAAAGWSGDRLRVYQRGEETAAVWLTAWDDEAEAEQAEAAAERVLEGSARREGRALLVVRGVPLSVAEHVLLDTAAQLPPHPPRAPSPIAP